MGRDIGFAIERRDDEGTFHATTLPFPPSLHVHGLVVDDRTFPFAFSTARRSEVFHVLAGYEDEEETWTRLAGGRGAPKDASPEVTDALTHAADPHYGEPGWATAEDFARYDLEAGYRIDGKREPFSEDAASWITTMGALLATLGPDARLVFWWF
ncbi:MAG: hypothetical protein U0169_04545 [Polyangiaceae bacterium]